MRKGYVRKSISEICDKASSNIAQNKIADIDGDYPVYGASGYVQNVDFYHRDTDYIGIVKDGSGVGRVNVYPAYSSLLGTMQYIIPKDGYLLGYVAYALKGLNLSSFASGAAIPHIYFKDYGKCKIDVPPLSEQQRIVSELDLLSSIIEKKKAQLKEYDQLAQSIFYDMFGDPVTNEKGWEVKRLGEVCAFSQGVQVDVSEQITIKKDGWNRFLRIVDYTTDNSDIRYVKIDNPKYILNKDDIAMVRYGASVGVSDCGKEGVLANNLFKIDYTKQFYDKHFLLFSFHTTYFDSFIEKVAFGAAMPALSFGVMRDFQIFLPPLSLQQSFAEKIEAIEQQKALIMQSITEAETLFNSRMDYYFN